MSFSAVATSYIATSAIAFVIYLSREIGTSGLADWHEGVWSTSLQHLYSIFLVSTRVRTVHALALWRLYSVQPCSRPTALLFRTHRTRRHHLRLFRDEADLHEYVSACRFCVALTSPYTLRKVWVCTCNVQLGLHRHFCITASFGLQPLYLSCMARYLVSINARPVRPTSPLG